MGNISPHRDFFAPFRTTAGICSGRHQRAEPEHLQPSRPPAIDRRTTPTPSGDLPPLELACYLTAQFVAVFFGYLLDGGETMRAIG